MPGLIGTITRPDAVFVAPFSAAALSRIAWPAFCSPAATTAARVRWSSWILVP